MTDPVDRQIQLAYHLTDLLSEALEDDTEGLVLKPHVLDVLDSLACGPFLLLPDETDTAAAAYTEAIRRFEQGEWT